MMRKTLMIAIAASMLAAAVPAAAGAAAKPGTAQIVSSVSFRTAPNTSSTVMRYLKKGESVAVLEQTNSYWLKVQDTSGQTGYISSSSSYVNLISAPKTDAGAGSAASNAVVTAGVSFRTAPSTSGARIRYLQKDEQVTVTSQVNAYWYAVTDAGGQAGYVSTDAKYIRLTGAIGGGTAPAAPTQPAPQTPAAGAGASNAVVVAGVSFRNAPSTSGARIRYLQKDEQVTVTAKINSYWYAVTDASGQSGYVSTDAKYIRLTGDIAGTPAPGTGTAPAGGGGSSQAPVSAQVEAVIAAGMKYLGTPYEYGSDRSTTTTFDCSDFVRTAFKDALGITLPADSASQGNYVRAKSPVTTDCSQLQRGDLVFFMDYKGTSASSYSSKAPFNTPITHVAIYLGNGQILHTYSNESGGVRVTSIQGTNWEYRFLYGGSAL